MNWDGAAPLVGAFVSGEIGDFALRVVSQTSSGRTSENSRKTRSHEVRVERAVLSALTRALCSPASCCWAADGPAGAGGSAWDGVLRPSTLRGGAAILPLPIMNIAPSNATTRSPEHPPTRTGRLSFFSCRWPLSRGGRLTARMRSVLDSQSDGAGEWTDLLGVTALLRNLHSCKRVANANAHADHSLELA